MAWSSWRLASSGGVEGRVPPAPQTPHNPALCPAELPRILIDRRYHEAARKEAARREAEERRKAEERTRTALAEADAAQAALAGAIPEVEAALAAETAPAAGLAA